ncbi:hypothetical protein SUGI_0666210 [Cryptomeria japonica]|nr:hypothetical protein SUGI_0666210 [Cryptomeria japonica]
MVFLPFGRVFFTSVRVGLFNPTEAPGLLVSSPLGSLSAASFAAFVQPLWMLLCPRGHLRVPFDLPAVAVGAGPCSSRMPWSVFGLAPSTLQLGFRPFGRRRRFASQAAASSSDSLLGSLFCAWTVCSSTPSSLRSALRRFGFPAPRALWPPGPAGFRGGFRSPSLVVFVFHARGCSL